MSPLFTTSPALDVDVVVIGGGIQGLWLLADLADKGYQAILLERMRPGFGQTGHSHVFLHEGHMYASMLREQPLSIIQRVESVLEANRLWKTALETGRLKELTPLKNSFYVGWREETNQATTFHNVCKQANIPCEDITGRPSEFGDLPMIKKLYKREGICLESRALLDQLLSQNNLRERVGYCKEIGVEAYDSGVFNLVVSCASDSPLKIRARALVLSAGAGNEKLVNRLFANAAINLDPAATRQQTVKTFMLVIRDLKRSLRPADGIAGMFPEFGGIFIVSRKDPQDRTVLLVGNGKRELVPYPGEMTASDAAAWFESLKIELEKLLPSVINNAEDFEWGIYEATKAEPWTWSRRSGDGGAFPRGYHIHKEPNIPMWLTWPTLLTFAPKVAGEIVEEITNTLSPAALPTSWGVWDDFCVRLTPSECRWKTTHLLGWDDFKRCFITSAPPL